MRKMQVANRCLSIEFYLQETQKVARDLLGKTLVRLLPNGMRLSGMIVETEAYLGATDPGAHTFKGRRTDRVRSMYLGGGHAYVYFIYGTHFCINAVTGPRDWGQAVLIRALEPLEGLDQMRHSRGLKLPDRQLTNGPGKLCQALQIDRSLDGTTFFGPDLFIEEGEAQELPPILTAARIGLGCQHEAARWPLRFLFKDHPYVSKKP